MQRNSSKWPSYQILQLRGQKSVPPSGIKITVGVLGSEAASALGNLAKIARVPSIVHVGKRREKNQEKKSINDNVF